MHPAGLGLDFLDLRQIQFSQSVPQLLNVDNEIVMWVIRVGSCPSIIFSFNTKFACGETRIETISRIESDTQSL